MRLHEIFDEEKEAVRNIVTLKYNIADKRSLGGSMRKSQSCKVSDPVFTMVSYSIINADKPNLSYQARMLEGRRNFGQNVSREQHL